VVRLREAAGPVPDEGRGLIPIYTGFDAREEIGWHAFTSSVMARASRPVSFIPLSGQQRDGTNAFTYARFAVPELQGHKRWALFADGCDMVCLADVAELWALRDDTKAVQVVQHDYKTRHPRKYVGTQMEAMNADYPRKNWSSLMLINCYHDAWKRLDLQTMTGPELHRFAFMFPDEVGALPLEWNWLADEYGPNADAKLLHWTAGIPAFPAYGTSPQANVWMLEAERARHATA
jgi:hypothetical protein